jgi:chemotaxis protein MotB
MLSDTGIAEKRLSALGFGSAQPISDNETAVGRARNRRVSIMILYETDNQDNASVEIIPNTNNATISQNK